MLKEHELVICRQELDKTAVLQLVCLHFKFTVDFHWLNWSIVVICYFLPGSRVYRPHGCIYAHWSACLQFITHSLDKKQLTLGLTGPFHCSHSRPFVSIVEGGWGGGSVWLLSFSLSEVLGKKEKNNLLLSPTCSVCFHFCSRASNMTLHSSWMSCCCQAERKRTQKVSFLLCTDAERGTWSLLSQTCESSHRRAPHPRCCPSRSSASRQWSRSPASYSSAAGRTAFAAGRGYWWRDPLLTPQTPSWRSAGVTKEF